MFHSRSPAGCFTVIAGPSGSGKSTIADLMVRLIDPDAGCGTVLLDGVDLRTLKIKSLRTAVVLIDQTPHLLHELCSRILLTRGQCFPLRGGGSSGGSRG